MFQSFIEARIWCLTKYLKNVCSFFVKCCIDHFNYEPAFSSVKKFFLFLVFVFKFWDHMLTLKSYEWFYHFYICNQQNLLHVATFASSCCLRTFSSLKPHCYKVETQTWYSVINWIVSSTVPLNLVTEREIHSYVSVFF